jgi:methyl coenzyme M reductase subunit D
MNETKLSEEQRLSIKCSQLEFVLAQERAQLTVRVAMETRDKTIEDIFHRHLPGENLADFTYDMETGVFKKREAPVVDADN